MRPSSAWIFTAVLACSSAFAAVEYTGGAYPDPFFDAAAVPKNTEKPAVDSGEKLKALATVQGILVSPEGNMAIVNGKVTRVGDHVMGYRVESIDPDGVTVVAGEGAGLTRFKLLHKGKVL